VISEADLHPHIRARMNQRGISLEELQITMSEGWDAEDAKEGTVGKVFVFPYNSYWEGKYFEKKEVTVYFKHKDKELVLLTAKARYGREFDMRGKK